MTGIEWTDRTWNPVTGCTKVSPGCDRCYAENIARRFAGSPAFPNGFDVTLRPERLAQPRGWRKPARVFVNSMSDLFHADVPDAFIARVWAVMAATPRHTYQVLTKRHGRMRALLSSPSFGHLVAEEGRRHVIGCQQDWVAVGAMLAHDVLSLPDGRGRVVPRPLPNVWVGVSAEDQRRAELRIPALLGTPAAVRFVSAEPLLGPIDLSRWLGIERYDSFGWGEEMFAALNGRVGGGLHWLIVGGESGPGARPMRPAWARDLVEQCHAAHVPVFVKQLGSAHGPHKGSDTATWPPELRVREWPTARPEVAS
ncbi:hypothetical protein BJF90_39320 [Pseudonocardia sp. CNS-004]|nr:hypothetical protein BJF90_39320 [Pseudonocardia sp. CNS-004]